MARYGLLAALLLLASQPASASAPENGETAKPPQGFVSAALQGDLSDIGTTLEGPFAARFEARFLHGEDDAAAGTADPEVARLITLYRTYWRKALLEPDAREALEDELAAAVSEVTGEPAGTAVSALPQFLDAKGYYTISGRTPPLLELIVWKASRTEETPVRLSDGEHSIPVIYLEDFESRGWSSFATFGRASTGGWSDSDGLHCVTESYDTSSENFHISFLKHEGRHYVDFTRYPALAAPDLEYRAKLEELAFAEDRMERLLAKFSGNAALIETAPHSLASYRVIEHMAEHVLGEAPAPDGLVDAARALADRPADELHAAALALLAAHDAQLQAAGAETAQGVIHP